MHIYIKTHNQQKGKAVICKNNLTRKFFLRVGRLLIKIDYWYRYSNTILKLRKEYLEWEYLELSLKKKKLRATPTVYNQCT